MQEVIRESIFLRYNLIHYLYTMFYDAVLTGVPIMRPMWLEFPQNTDMFSITSQFMFGDSILFAPKLNVYNQDIDVYFPQEATWYEFNSRSPKEETS